MFTLSPSLTEGGKFGTRDTHTTNLFHYWKHPTVNTSIFLPKKAGAALKRFSCGYTRTTDGHASVSIKTLTGQQSWQRTTEHRSCCRQVQRALALFLRPEAYRRPHEER